MTMETLEFPASAARTIRFPNLSMRTGKPTTHRVKMRVRMPMSGGTAAANAAGFAAAATLGVGVRTYRYVELRIPMRQSETTMIIIRLLASLAVLSLGAIVAVGSVASALEPDGNPWVALAAIPTAAIAVLLVWLLSVRNRIASRVTPAGMIRLRAHPDFVAAVRGATPTPPPATFPGATATAAPARQAAPTAIGSAGWPPSPATAARGGATWPPRGSLPTPAVAPAPSTPGAAPARTGATWPPRPGAADAEATPAPLPPTRAPSDGPGLHHEI